MGSKGEMKFNVRIESISGIAHDGEVVVEYKYWTEEDAHRRNSAISVHESLSRDEVHAAIRRRLEAEYREHRKYLERMGWVGHFTFEVGE